MHTVHTGHTSMCFHPESEVGFKCAYMNMHMDMDMDMEIHCAEHAHAHIYACILRTPLRRWWQGVLHLKTRPVPGVCDNPQVVSIIVAVRCHCHHVTFFGHLLGWCCCWLSYCDSHTLFTCCEVLSQWNALGSALRAVEDALQMPCTSIVPWLPFSSPYLEQCGWQNC